MSNGAPRPVLREKMKIVLKYPIFVENEPVTELNVPVRANGGEMMAIDSGKGDVERMLLFISKAARIPFSSAKQIDYEDLQEGSELESYLARFFQRKTGDKSSED